MSNTKLAFLTMGAAAVATALAGVALATPGSNVVGTIWATAGFADPVDITFKLTEDHTKGKEVLHVRDAQDTVIQQIVFGPSGHTGWHSHPGPAVVLVTDGELTLYSGEDPTCTGRTYSAGQAFIDSGQGHVHIGRNPSPTQNTVLWVTYFDVPPGGTARIDAADPGNCVF
jgi:quercetin dioxygenase-like cupin family protein